MEEATISWFPYLEFATDTSMIDTCPTLILGPDRPFHINIGQKRASFCLSTDTASSSKSRFRFFLQAYETSKAFPTDVFHAQSSLQNTIETSLPSVCHLSSANQSCRLPASPPLLPGSAPGQVDSLTATPPLTTCAAGTSSVCPWSW